MRRPPGQFAAGKPFPFCHSPRPTPGACRHSLAFSIRNLFMLNTLLIATGTVALAEIGDKTQLLALLLSARFRRP